MLRRLIGALATSAAVIATIGLSPAPAYAEANPPNCPKGYFCMYSGQNQTGTLLARTLNNWSGFQEGVQSIFNNGSACSGCDHVYVLHYYVQRNETVCLHFNPGPGRYKLNWAGGAIVKGVEWGGECPPIFP